MYIWQLVVAFCAGWGVADIIDTFFPNAPRWIKILFVIFVSLYWVLV